MKSHSVEITQISVVISKSLEVYGWETELQGTQELIVLKYLAFEQW